MTDLQKINFSIQLIIILGKANNQQDLGLKLGYENKSSFSTAINKKPSSIKFIKKLRDFDENVNKLWENDFMYVLNPVDCNRKIELTDDELIEELKRRLRK